jgi:PAS domain S-box-containing protein
MQTTTPATRRPLSIVDFASLLFLGAVWGAAFLFLRIAAPEIGPAWAAEIRLAVGAVVLLAVAGPAMPRIVRGRVTTFLIVGALWLPERPWFYLIAGVLMLVHRRSPGRDRASLIDSLIIAVGVGTLSWVFLLAPYAHDQSLTLLQKLTAMAYPIMDLLLFGVAVRLAVDRGKRPPAFYLMAGAVMVLFTTDTIYTLILLHGTYDNTTGLLELGWGLFYLLWGAAALHTSMVDLDDPAPEGDLQHPRRRLMILAGASLIAPTVEMIQALRGEQVDVPVLAGCSALLFVLVLVRLNGLMVDIGEYRRTERQMREAEAKYRSLVEGLPAVVYIAEFGKDAAWTYISPKVESILGFTPDEWTGQADLWRERILPEDRELALDAEMRLLNGEPRMHCEYRIIGKNGRVIWIHEEAEALADDGGRPLYLQGVMYDVTEQKNAEAQLVKALAAEKEAATRLRALHEMQNSFLQAVSHDLRTPLTSILGCALTLESSLDQEQISREDEHDLVGRIATNARKLHRLLTNLLDLDRMSRGIVAPNRDDVDMNQILASVLEESSTDTHSIQITSSGPVHAYVDAAQVERIVENLVVNAIRYTPAGTPIWVRATGDAESVLIVVEDAGPGIPEELRDSIFEPFRQGNEVVTHNPGVGIGLSLVTRFAELHGGRAWVEEREGGGASFRVYLPFASATDESYEDLSPSGSLAPATTDASQIG